MTKPEAQGKFRKLLVGAGWNYGAQVATIIPQFVYAAITSRMILPEGFGAYAVALSVASIANILASGGLSFSIARMEDFAPRKIGGLASFALLLGLAAAAFLYLTAELWASFWGVAAAADPIRLLGISALISPSIGLVTGLLLRGGRFKAFSISAVCCNVSGMVIGAIAVTVWGTAEALVVSAIASQVLSLLVGHIFTRGVLLRLGNPVHAGREISYGSHVTGSNLLSYLSVNMSKWGVSNAVGPAVMGHWNRADTVTTLLFIQLQTALGQAVFPEFRHDINSPIRARRVWPDLLSLVAWLTVPAGAIWAILVPFVVPLLFGNGWSAAAVLGAPLAVLGGLQVVFSLLNSAVNTLGRYRWLWSTQLIMIVVQLPLLVAVFTMRDIGPAIVGLYVAAIAQHAWHIWLCARAGYLDVAGLLRRYLSVAIAAIICAAVTWIILRLAVLAASGGTPLLWLAALIVTIGAGYAAWMLRRKYPPLRIAREYGLF